MAERFLGLHACVPGLASCADAVLYQELVCCQEQTASGRAGMRKKALPTTCGVSVTGCGGADSTSNVV